jgi:hypothetical protein
MEDRSQEIALTRLFFADNVRPDAVLLKQLSKAEAYAKGCITPSLEAHQWVAINCLFSDVLSGLAHPLPNIQLKHTPLVLAINKGHMQIAAAEFYSFCFSHGRAYASTYKKRGVESTLFVTGVLEEQP